MVCLIDFSICSVCTNKILGNNGLMDIFVLCPIALDDMGVTVMECKPFLWLGMDVTTEPIDNNNNEQDKDFEEKNFP